MKGRLPPQASPKLKPLTEMQHQFVSNYIKLGGNAYQSAIKAGYSEHSAHTHTHNILNIPSVKQRIERGLAKAEDKLINKLGLTYEWKAKKLKRVIDEYIPDGKDVTLVTSEVKVGLIALAELNKMQGDYAPDKRLSLTVDATKDKLAEVKRKYEEY